jgi:hypothetical protein
MSKLIAAALAGVLMAGSLAAAPAFAQAPAAAAKVNFATTKINDLIKDAKAKALLEKTLPQITDYYSQIGDMTLTDVIPLSEGALDEAKLTAMQAEYDKG